MQFVLLWKSYFYPNLIYTIIGGRAVRTGGDGTYFHCIFKANYSCVLLLAAITYTNAKAAPDAKAQVPYSAGPVSAPLVVNPAKPYSFAYEVIDPAGGNAYGHRESSDGTVVEGEYRVVLPDTRTQIVT